MQPNWSLRWWFQARRRRPASLKQLGWSSHNQLAPECPEVAEQHRRQQFGAEEQGCLHCSCSSSRGCSLVQCFGLEPGILRYAYHVEVVAAGGWQVNRCYVHGRHRQRSGLVFEAKNEQESLFRSRSCGTGRESHTLVDQPNMSHMKKADGEGCQTRLKLGHV